MGTDLKDFESREQALFLNRYWAYDNLRNILSNLSEDDFPDVVAATKEGLEKGVEDFLKKSDPEPASLYLADLVQFSWDTSTQRNVAAELGQLPFDLNNIDPFAESVCQEYRSFIYNESLTRFRKAFKR
ncbi:hypothetical protein GF351_02320 [Candidatus Woesearchaeota archaeon]|nr:hypothetical protein [Candidatus Woesearchaeota archaeon]